MRSARTTDRFARGAPCFAALIVALSGPALAQSQAETPGAHAPPKAHETDAALSALIPDAAVADPQGWALDTDAAHHAPDPATLPDVSALDGTPMPAIPGLTIAWPDSFDAPPIDLLTPDPDIDAAATVARDAGAVLDAAMPRGGWRGPLGADALVRHAGPGIDLVFPPGTVLPEMDDLADRFEGLSSLHTLGRTTDNLAQMTRRARDDVDLLLQILRMYGYYDAEVSENLVGLSSDAVIIQTAPAKPRKGRPAAAAITVRFEIVPGARYPLAAIALGDVAQSPDKTLLLTALKLKTGDPANTETIQAARDRLIDELGHIGYAFNKVGDPALSVDHAALNADLDIPAIIGGKYVFGHVTSSLPQFLNARHLQRIARFRAGRIYDRRLVDDFRQGILQTGIVGGVKIVPRETVAPTPTAPGVADIDVALTKGPQHSVTLQGGQSSGQGFYIEGSWEDRNKFPPEGMVGARGILGTREQLAGLTFRKSNFLARDQSFTADVYAQAQTTDAYNAHTLSATITLAKTSTLIFQKRWAYSFGFEVIATQELLAGSPPNSPFTTYFIAALPMKFGFDGSNNLLDPERGVRAAITVQPAISIQDGPKSSYVMTQFDGSTYQSVGHGVVLAERVRFASINGTSLVNIAPSQRLYAGGGASIRGYGYQDVGPKDASHNPVGGLSVAEFSLEARVKTGLMGGALSVVPFLDSGTAGATPTPTMRGAKFGAGLGVRYKTTFGPIRVDVGTPLNPSPGDSRIGVYIGLGQAF
ncbi:autotransporter assembly complex protein TamA [Novosphingobium sp.]|uniref:autotransporter assembly complex protein TamA n=1 Tax=Novosphingobium sp. TaxID=1874826 RepID=UPI003D0BAE59